MEDIIKEYSNGEITIVWEPKKCIHSAVCKHGLIEVFNPQARPWINIHGSNSERISEQVKKCPSGALSIKDKINNENKMENSTTNTSVSVIKNGPLMVKGTVTIKHKDGSEETKNDAFLCRCGQSENKPFCDGAHKKCGFKDE
ncbi:MAG TPA: (4Fe-4S)-binding protein [Chitinophagales bacterium]|nr:(4Fe-4S)-binding protein [Chitinophagales bacterium]